MAGLVDKAVIKGFVAEAYGYLPAIRRAAQDSDSAALTAVESKESEAVIEQGFRFLHSIKGAAAMIGFFGLSQMAWLCEEVMEELVAGTRRMDAAMSEFLLGSLDEIEHYLDGLESDEVDEARHVGAVVRAWRRLRGQPESGDDEAIKKCLPEEVEEKPLATSEEIENRSERSGARPMVEEAPESLLDAFRWEAEEHLQAINASLREMGAESSEQEAVQTVRRVVHTLKGAASMVGFFETGRLAHRMEDLLDALFAGSIGVDEEIQTLLFETADLLEELVAEKPDGTSPALPRMFSRYEEILGGPAETPRDFAHGAAELRASLGDERVFALKGTARRPDELDTPGDDSRPRPLEASEVIRVPLSKLDELIRLVSELVVHRSVFEQHHIVLAQHVGELGLSIGRLRDISTSLETDFEVAALLGGGNSGLEPASNRQLASASLSSSTNASVSGTSVISEFDDLEFDRYGEFHLLSRAVSETTSDVGAVGAELVNVSRDVGGALTRLGQLSSEVQERLMRLRMVPLASLASRLHRAVRVTAKELHKDVDLVLGGDRVELDKSVIEELADPLLHLVRNAVDHGIEPSALRLATGKPERGLVKVESYYEGTEVVVEIIDDGAGLNLDSIRKTALRRELISDADESSLADSELLNFVFIPGFSTSNQVSEISGRGVGLDVLKETVTRLKGRLGVHTVSGLGTRFTIRLPMTLAITRVLFVRVRNREFAVPLAAVVNILRVEREKIDSVSGEPAILVEGGTCPVIDLGDALGLESIPDSQQATVPVLVVGLGERRLAVAVDRLLDARDVVVKTFGSLIRKVPRLSGATLMGDGRVVPIIDPSGLFSDGDEGYTRFDAGRPVPGEPRQQRPLEVFIVDDSLSVRKVLGNLAKSAGWTSRAAKDGVEALELLHRGGNAPDIALLDIEMPRMDGYELLATLRADPLYQDLPVVMITSRSGQKHRQKAFDLGVSEYLVKPYQPDTLINVVARLTRSRQASRGERDA